MSVYRYNDIQFTQIQNTHFNLSAFGAKAQVWIRTEKHFQAEKKIDLCLENKKVNSTHWHPSSILY